MKALVLVTTLLFTVPSIGETMSQMDRIKDVFNRLRADNMEILDQFYHPDALFIDPLGRHEGRESVKAYYSNLYKNVTEIHFEFVDNLSVGNKHLLVWKMHLKAKGLKGGETVTLDGNSVIHFNDQDHVSYHRDYFDMGEFIYEQVPVLSWVISKVKERLKN